MRLTLPHSHGPNRFLVGVTHANLEHALERAHRNGHAATTPPRNVMKSLFHLPPEIALCRSLNLSILRRVGDGFVIGRWPRGSVVQYAAQRFFTKVASSWTLSFGSRPYRMDLDHNRLFNECRHQCSGSFGSKTWRAVRS